MSVAVAPGLNQIQPSRIRELANVAFTMEGVYALHFGESNMPTPQYIKDAAAQALNDGWTFYSENAGAWPRMMLHAEELRLRHPDGGRGMRFFAKAPF